MDSPGGLALTIVMLVLIVFVVIVLVRSVRIVPQARAGVVAHGLFLGLATDVIVAGPSGVEHRTR